MWNQTVACGCGGRGRVIVNISNATANPVPGIPSLSRSKETKVWRAGYLESLGDDWIASEVNSR